MWSWSGLVQYGSAEIIQAYCDITKNAEGNAAEKLAAFLQAYAGTGCRASYSAFAEFYSSPNLTTDACKFVEKTGQEN